MTAEQKELLATIVGDDHCCFNPDFVARCAKAFGVKLKPREQRNLRVVYNPTATGVPMGLGADEIIESICRQYGVLYTTMHGMGSQVWECHHQLQLKIDAGCTDLQDLAKDILRQKLDQRQEKAKEARARKKKEAAKDDQST